jgi:GNAT superfamily N-acetyltransferase
MSGDAAPVSAPEPLQDGHVLDPFQCGVASLDDWLKRRARPNQAGGASRTDVITAANKVMGYYCLSSGAIAVIEAPGKIRRNMPDHHRVNIAPRCSGRAGDTTDPMIPMAVLGRLAIDREWQGKGIGVALLQDAVLRTAQAAGILGIRGLLVHAISDEAKAFYEHHGFMPAPADPMTLLLSIKGMC